MCGITGFWDFRKRVTESNLLLMTNTLAHRGSDNSGLFIIYREFDVRESTHIYTFILVGEAK
jgi:asparagine synthetase B (glutamine-hydrolysing)